MSYQAFLLLCLLGACYGFRGELLSNPSEETHAKITEDALRAAAAEYVKTEIFKRAKSAASADAILTEYFKGCDHYKEKAYNTLMAKLLNPRVGIHVENNPSDNFFSNENVGSCVKFERKIDRNTDTLLGPHFFEIFPTEIQDDSSYERFNDNGVDVAKRVQIVKSAWRKNAARNMNGERIVEGNTILQSLRKSLIEKANKKTTWDVEEGIQLVAEYLYTLQEFYSSTNWVEMNGATPYDDLGISSQPIMATSKGAITSVCKSCSNYIESHPNSNPDSCEGNIINNVLTSGYKGGQDAVKPTEPTSQNEGKCSHGGKFDSSRTTKATGGINKETSDPELSPHYKLHQDAGTAAFLASKNFFIGKDTSLVKLIPEEAFQDLLSLTRGVSLVFVIDDTGSMSDEIAAVRLKTIDMVKKSKGTSSAPYDYILSTFNDPETLNTIHSTKDSQDMIDRLNKVRAHGGGDCAELALHGIMAALKICRPFSTIFVFTDAPTKELAMAVTVMRLATEKNVKITFLLTPGCKRKKRSLEVTAKNRIRRASGGFDIYSEIAQETGGGVYHTTNENIAETLLVIDESLSGKGIDLMEKVITPVEEEPLPIPVDEEVSVLTIEVSGVSALIDVNLYNPTGDEETFTKSDDSKIMLSSTIMLLKKSNPTGGVWKLKRKPGLKVTVIVRGSGEITFRPSLRERLDGLLYPVNGHPLANTEYVVAVVMDGYEKIKSLDNLMLVTYEGDVIDTIPIPPGSTQSFTAPVNLTNKAFMFAINGTDTSGFPFIRMVKKLIRPVSVKLELLPFEGDLAAGESMNITFSIKNEGEGSATTSVTLAHSEQVSSSAPHKTNVVAAKSNLEDHITVTATNVQSLVHLKLTLKVSGTVLQEISQQMLIVDPYAPVCTVLTTNNNCRDLLLEDCASLSWNSTFQISEKGFGLLRIFSSANESVVKFSHKDFTPGFKGNVAGTISGSCCTDKTEVHGEDLGGAVGSCFFTHTFREHEEKEKEPKDYGLVIGLCLAGVALLILIIIIAVILIKRRRQNYEKMT